jgi:hypothetical protein
LLSAAKRCSAIRHGLLSNSRAQNSKSQFFILELACATRFFGGYIGLLVVFQWFFLFLWPEKGLLGDRFLLGFQWVAVV